MGTWAKVKTGELRMKKVVPVRYCPALKRCPPSLYYSKWRRAYGGNGYLVTLDDSVHDYSPKIEIMEGCFMTKSIRKYMRVGLVHFMAYPSTMDGIGIEETIRIIALDDYFDAIEISWIEDADVRSNVKRILDCSRLTVVFGGQSILLRSGKNINDLDESKRNEASDLLKKGIDQAYEMDAISFAFFSGHYQEKTKEASFQALIKSTKELCSYAKSKGDMKIALEVFDFDIDKKSLIGPVALARRLAKDITQEYDNFGLIVDLSHIPMLYETNEESIVPIKDYIIHAHMGNTVIKDSKLEAYGDNHPRFGFPNSENDVEELTAFLRILKRTGFLCERRRPIVSFEVKPWADEDPELVIANAKRTLNAAWIGLDLSSDKRDQKILYTK